MSREIKINITKGKLKDFTVDLGEDKADLTATITLFAGQKRITSFQISTKEYFGTAKFELPASLINPILSIANELEIITIRECNKAMGELPAPEGSDGLQ